MTNSRQPGPATVHFGSFEANLETHELRKSGIRLRLPGQSFQILRLLLERPGRLVTREEFRQTLWPDDTYVDFEHGLNAAVNRLRDALGDPAENPQYVETLTRRGYRWIGGCEPGQGNGTGARKSNYLRLATICGAAMLTLVVGVGARFFRGNFSALSPTRPPIQSLAVLPLANLSGDAGQEYFSDGMTDELIAELAKITSLRVTSRTSIIRYKGERNKPLSQIAQELHVDALLEGSVLHAGDRVRIAVHMIYAPTDHNLLTATYERDMGDVLKLQREIAEAVTKQVRLTVDPEQRIPVQQVDPGAYEAYLKGLSFDRTRHQEIKKAQGYYQYAIQKDSGFAPAYVQLARSYRNLGQFEWLSPQDAYPPAKRAILKALELDETNCDAHWSLAWLAWNYDWDWQTAETELSMALKLCPNSAMIHEYYAYYLGWKGRAIESRQEIAKCYELDPLMGDFLIYEAVINYLLSDYQGTIEVGQRAVASDPNSWLAHHLLGSGYEQSGRMSEAIAEYQEAVRLSEGDQEPTASLAHAYAITGKKPEALKILREWQHQSKTRYISAYMIATIFAGLGDKDRAFEFLERAYQERSPDVAYFLKTDPRIANLRPYSQFHDLLRRMNFPQP